MTDVEFIDFHRRIKQARSDANLTQRELAFMLGKKTATLGSWESESAKQRRFPSYDDLISFAKHTKHNIEWLVAGTGQAKETEEFSEFLTIPQINHIPVLENLEEYDQTEFFKFEKRLLENYMNSFDGAFVLVCMGGHLAPMVNPNDKLVIQRNLKPTTRYPTNDLWAVQEGSEIGIATYRFEGDRVMFRTSKDNKADQMEVLGKAVFRYGKP